MELSWTHKSNAAQSNDITEAEDSSKRKIQMLRSYLLGDPAMSLRTVNDTENEVWKKSILIQ